MSEPLPVEERALAAIREWVRNLAVKFDLIAPGITPWSQHDNRRIVVAMMKSLAASRPSGMLCVVDQARAGWDIADEALRQLIVEYIEHGQPMPTSLAAYNQHLVHSPRRKLRGKKKADYVVRDVAIAALVGDASAMFNLHLTGRSSRRRSACYLVAQALGEEAHILMSDKAVETIWLEYGPSIVPQSRPS